MKFNTGLNSNNLKWNPLRCFDTKPFHINSQDQNFFYLFLLGIFEKWNHIFKQERDFCLIYRNNFDHSKVEGWGGVCNCETWGSASQVDLCKAISFLTLIYSPGHLSVLNLSGHVCLILETLQTLSPAKDSDKPALCKVPAAAGNKVAKKGPEEIHLMDYRAPGRVITVSYASQAKFFQDLT